MNDWGDDIPPESIPAASKYSNQWHWKEVSDKGETMVFARYSYFGVVIRGVIYKRSMEFRASAENGRKTPEYGQGATLQGAKKLCRDAMLRLAWREKKTG